ncbi:MAG: hypothetical protein AABW92_04355, partial [Nanoarchaeota archaeon]
YTVYGPGVYSTSKLKPGARKFIPSENVYINTNCEKCLDKTNCAADNFCHIQDVGIDQYDYSAQLNFDLYTLTRNVEDAEICMYNYYTSGEPSTLYFKYAPESFCSDITGANIASNFITYQVVNNTYQAVKNQGEWVCTNVNSLIKEAQFNKLTNLFVNVLGEDVNGGNKPFNCFRGISDLSTCSGTNPSGASDCRPYLLINDEWIR